MEHKIQGQKKYDRFMFQKEHAVKNVEDKLVGTRQELAQVGAYVAVNIGKR